MWAFLWIRTESRELHLGFGAAVLALFRKKYPCLLQLNIPTTPNVYEKWLWIKVVCKLSKSTDTNLTQWSLTCLTLSLVLKCLNKWQYEVGWKKQSAFFWPMLTLTGACFGCFFGQWWFWQAAFAAYLWRHLAGKWREAGCRHLAFFYLDKYIW